MATFIPVRLDVKRTDFEQQCYIVDYENQEYAVPQFTFQISHTQPETLNCLVEKDDSQQVTQITQDATSMLQQFYRVGQSYMFRVKSSQPINGDHYELEDNRKLTFNLFFTPTINLKEGQYVKCQIREISSGRLSLDFQNVVDETDTLEKLRLELEGKAATMGQDGSTLFDLLFDTEPSRPFDHDIDQWLINGVEECMGKAHLTDEALAGIARVNEFCLYVLEDSRLLRSLHPDALQAMQCRLDQVAGLAETMGEALELTRDGRAAEQVEQTLKKLDASGYLFDAQRKLQRTDYILTLNPDLFASHIGTVIEVITKRENANLREQEPFTSVFMRMLEHYIHQIRKEIDNVSTAVGDELTQNRLSNMVKALAIQQLMAQGRTSVPFDLTLNRSLLYRYITFQPGVNASRMLEKAYACLMNNCGEPLEFGWDALSSDLLVAMKMNNQPQPAEKIPMQQRSFTTNQVQLTLGPEIALEPAHTCLKCKNVLPQPDMLPWHHMEVRLTNTIHFQKAQDKENLLPYEQLWKNIERHLFTAAEVPSYVQRTPQQMEKPVTSRTPEEGTIVTIRVTHKMDLYGARFHCVIVDNDHKGYKGEGEFNANDIVNYKFQPDLSVFENDEGWPLLLEAKVENIDEEGHIHFNLREPISQAIIDDFNDLETDSADKLLNYGENYLCVITNFSQARNSYAAVASNGLTFSFQRPEGDEVLPNSTYVEVRLLNRARSGNGMHEAEFVKVVTDRHFLTQNAVNNLLQWYSFNEVWNPAEESERAVQENTPESADSSAASGNAISALYVGELTLLIDRLAVVTTDYRLAYNYLGFARLLTLALDNQQLADYYNKRMKFIRMLQYFETNGSIDEPELLQSELMGADVVKNYQGLYTQYLQLRCVSYMQKPQHNADLWATIQMQGTDSGLARLAKLVLAYNLLGEFRQQQGQILVHKEINNLLGIKGRESELRNFGEEDFHTEFKTSIVFPPNNNMREDVKRQTDNIMHVICGFLNAEGGQLYLGVNNEGMGTGLQADAQSKTFNNGKNFHDTFDRYVTDHVRLNIGIEEAMCVNGEWVEANGRDVYCLNIKPSARVARYEGRCWRRVGTESVELRGETLHRFQEQRPTEMRSRLMEGETATSDMTTAPAATPQSATPEPSASPIIEKNGEGQELTLSREMSIRGTVYPRYEGAYARGYINIIDRFHYMHTEDDYPYTGQARISVPVYEGMNDPYMLLVYTDGTALRVPVEHIFDQQQRQLFTLYKSEADILFAAIMDSDDLLLTQRRDRRGRLLSRCDSVAMIEADNSLNSRGHLLVNEGLGEFVTCALINEHQGEFRRITDTATSSLGCDLTAKSYASMRQTLCNMGLGEELGLE